MTLAAWYVATWITSMIIIAIVSKIQDHYDDKKGKK
jgi:hypothetical protein